MGELNTTTTATEGTGLEELESPAATNEEAAAAGTDPEATSAGADTETEEAQLDDAFKELTGPEADQYEEQNPHRADNAEVLSQYQEIRAGDSVYSSLWGGSEIEQALAHDIKKIIEMEGGDVDSFLDEGGLVGERAIEEAQRILSHKVGPIRIDGAIGPQTMRAIDIALERSNYLATTAEGGPESWLSDKAHTEAVSKIFGLSSGDFMAMVQAALDNAPEGDQLVSTLYAALAKMETGAGSALDSPSRFIRTRVTAAQNGGRTSTAWGPVQITKSLVQGVLNNGGFSTASPEVRAYAQRFVDQGNAMMRRPNDPVFGYGRRGVLGNTAEDRALYQGMAEQLIKYELGRAISSTGTNDAQRTVNQFIRNWRGTWDDARYFQGVNQVVQTAAASRGLDIRDLLRSGPA